VVALSDVNNVVVESYSYDVFGAPTIYDANYTEITQSAIGNPYMFTARRADDETALYYYRARYYAFDIGRFLQTDPIGYIGRLNLYSYCGNNPINWIDPLGLLAKVTYSNSINIFSGGVITIEIPIVYTGEGKTEEIVERFNTVSKQHGKVNGKNMRSRLRLLHQRRESQPTRSKYQ